MDYRAFVFTVHKAASVGVHYVLRDIARKQSWPFFSPNRRTPNLIEPKEPGDKTFFDQLDGETGLVGPVRMPVALPEDARERDIFIVHLRDPRDVLVSMYFSWGYSHPGVDPGYRASLRETGVDAFVLKASAALKQKYDLYERDYLPLPRTTFVKYEDFVLDRGRWLDGVLTALGLAPQDRRYRHLLTDNPAENITEEDVYRHIRKAAPGDFREKLKGDTINTLNTQWADSLTALGYAI